MIETCLGDSGCQCFIPDFQGGPNDPCHLLFMCLCSPVPCCIRLTHRTNRILWKWQMWLLRLGHKRHYDLSCSLMNLSLWEKSAARSWGYPSSPVEALLRWGTEASCQQPCDWATLETDLPPDDWSPNPLDYTHMRKPEQNHFSKLLNSQPTKNEILNVYGFKPTSFGGNLLHSTG